MSPALMLVLMALASYRVWRLVGEDSWPPSEAFRRWIEERHGAALIARGGATRGRAFRRARRWEVVHELITCPWCLGSWVAGAVVLVVDQVYGLEAPVLQWGAVACLVGLIGRVDG